MNLKKIALRKEAEKEFSKNGISYKQLNNGVHWKIGQMNFYPTTYKWFNEITGERGRGLEECIKILGKRKPEARYFTVEQIFEFATKSKKTNLYEICEAIHAGIYADKESL